MREGNKRQVLQGSLAAVIAHDAAGAERVACSFYTKSRALIGARRQAVNGHPATMILLVPVNVIPNLGGGEPTIVPTRDETAASLLLPDDSAALFVRELLRAMEGDADDERRALALMREDADKLVDAVTSRISGGRRIIVGAL